MNLISESGDVAGVAGTAEAASLGMSSEATGVPGEAVAGSSSPHQLSRMAHVETHSDAGVNDLASVAQGSENKRQHGSVSLNTAVLLQET